MTRPAYNTISISQRLKLIDFLRSKTYPDGTSARKIAEEAALSVGFPVTEHNIQSTAKAVGIELPLARAPKVNPLDEIRARLDTLERHTAAMQAAINAMYPIGSTPYSPQLIGPVTCNADEYPVNPLGDWPAGSDQPA